MDKVVAEQQAPDTEVPPNRRDASTDGKEEQVIEGETRQHGKGFLVKGCRCCFPPDTMFEVGIVRLVLPAEMHVTFQCRHS